MASYQVFTQTALATETFFFAWFYSNITRIYKFKNRFDNFHLFIHSDVCPIIPNLNNYVWKRKKNHKPIHSEFGNHPYRLSFIDLVAFSWTGLVKPEFSLGSFALLFSNMFFLFFYLALPIIFMAAVDLGLMKIKKIMDQRALHSLESERVKSNRV
jgi:hypothetical protein